MLGLITTVAGWVLGWANKKADGQIELARIEGGISVEEIKGKVTVAGYSRDVMVAAMGQRVFWVVWSLFAIPLGLWWALAMGGTVHGLRDWLPVVDALNVAVKPYADQIFNNVFYSGAGMAGLQTVAKALRR